MRKGGKTRQYRNGGGNKSSSSASSSVRQDYEYFQLYDPDDSDLESEVDPDVKSLLANHAASLNFSDPTGERGCCTWWCLCFCCRWCLGARPVVWANKYLRLTRCQLAGLVCALALVASAVVLGLVLGLASSSSSSTSGSHLTATTPEPDVAKTSSLSSGDDPVKMPPPSPSQLGEYDTAAVAVDGEPCAQIGLDVLKRNGTAVDSAVAALFCNGIFNAQSMGIGGGFLMTIYHRQNKTAVALDARETAPAAATVNMYHGNQNASSVGPKSAGVPGEVRGYWAAKKRFGNPEVSWASLVEPSVKLCREGVRVSFSMEKALKNKRELILADPGMRSAFVDPATGDILKEGDTVRRPVLADTLERIAQNGEKEFYEGETGRKLLKDMNKAGGIITEQDLKDYQVKWTDAISAKIGSHVVHSVPPPGSGAILAYILNILQHYDIKPGDADDPVFYHRVVEAFKWAYAVRTRLGDPADEAIADEVDGLVRNMTSAEWGLEAFRKINDSLTVNNASYYGADFYTPEDHGTAHVSVLSPNGDAVSVTSTVNLHFGSCFLSPSTGVIVNDEMDDFSYPSIVNEFNVPPSPHNFVRPGKRPLSSMSPAVFVDEEGDARLVVGAAGGTKITTATALTAIRNLWLGEDVKSAVDARRVHHQLAPMRVDYEEGLTRNVTEFLQSRGHKLNRQHLGESIVCAVARDDEGGGVHANADFRKAGGVAGF